jgi:methylmalonyl-CoA mutase C-terminal domain/subunit
LFPKIVEQLRARDMSHVLLVAGGTIPPRDVQRIKDMGVNAVFGPGSSLSQIVEYIRQNAPKPESETL